MIAAGLFLLKRGLRYRITGEQSEWLQDIPKGELINREKYILMKCAEKSVLHIGFVDSPYTSQKMTDGSLLHLKLKKSAKKIYGVDTDNEAVQLFKSVTGDENASSDGWEGLSSGFVAGFDIVLAGELLEHLDFPGKLIDRFYKKMYKGQYLIISVPNITSLDAIAASLNRSESVHPDHHWYFSPFTLLKKFPADKWQMIDFAFGLYGSLNDAENNNPLLKHYPNLGDCLLLTVQKK